MKLTSSKVIVGRLKLMVIADELRKWGEFDFADRIVKIVTDDLTRASPKRRASVKAVRPSPVMKAKMRAVARAEPDTPLRDIGLRFGCDGGRVSEAINKK